MLRTDQLDSLLFMQWTGRRTPRLQHPTANAFDPNLVELSLKAIDAPTERDAGLALSALHLHAEIHRLRNGPLRDALGALTQDTIIRLAIAEANRGHMIVRRRLQAALSKYSKEERPLHHIRPLVDANISRFQPDATPDDVNTMIVDTIPHWLAQAAGAKAEEDGVAVLGRAAQRAQLVLSIERSLRNFWQSVLWEGWFVAESADGEFILSSDNLEDATLWAAWEGRFEVSGAPRAPSRSESKQ
jgi:hypothetical protein